MFFSPLIETVTYTCHYTNFNFKVNYPFKELREEFEAIATETKQTRDRIDSVQAAPHEDKRTVTDSHGQRISWSDSPRR